MKYQFIQEPEDYERSAKIVMETPSNPTLPELISHFEDFILGSTFTLPKGATLGYEYEDVSDEVDEKEYLAARRSISNFLNRSYPNSNTSICLTLLCRLIDDYKGSLTDSFMIELKKEICRFTEVL
jgi:hypothetical protein